MIIQLYLFGIYSSMDLKLIQYILVYIRYRLRTLCELAVSVEIRVNFLYNEDHAFFSEKKGHVAV